MWLRRRHRGVEQSPLTRFQPPECLSLPLKQELEAERAEVQVARRRRDPAAADDRRDGDDAPAGGTVTVDLGAAPGDCSIDSEGATSNSEPSLQGGGSGASPSTGLEESL